LYVDFGVIYSAGALGEARRAKPVHRSNAQRSFEKTPIAPLTTSSDGIIVRISGISGAAILTARRSTDFTSCAARVALKDAIF
jgi:hypothetical protein